MGLAHLLIFPFKPLPCRPNTVCPSLVPGISPLESLSTKAHRSSVPKTTVMSSTPVPVMCSNLSGWLLPRIVMKGHLADPSDTPGATPGATPGRWVVCTCTCVLVRARVCLHMLVHLHTWVLVKSCLTKDLTLLYVPKRCHQGVLQAELARMPTPVAPVPWPKGREG